MAETAPTVRLEALLAHREWARGLARALVRDDAEADDLAQEVWLSAVRRPPADLSAPRGWLATALRHAFLNLRRGERRRDLRERASVRSGSAPPADAVVAEAEAHRRVVEAVMELDEPYRTAILLRFFEGLSPASVAAATGVPTETARTRIRRAVATLRDRLGDDGRPGRRALGLVLLPLLGDAPGRGAAALPLSLSAGGLAMTLKTKAALAAVAILLAVGGWLLMPGDAPASPPPVAAAPPEPEPPSPPPPPAPAPAPAPAAVVKAPAAPAPPPPPDPLSAPSCTLVIRAIDDATGQPLPEFQAAVRGSAHQQARSEGGVILLTTVPVPADGRLRVALLEPRPAKDVEEVVTATAGERVEVTLRLRFEGPLRGRVLGPDDMPLQGAQVWFGGPEVVRGDEPFKPWDRKRMRGAPTDLDGAFELRGRGTTVSAWHPDFSPATVPVGSAGTIRLAERGSIRGTVVDASRAPRPGVKVSLDRDRTATTDDDGSFVFEKVEAGPRGINLDGDKRRWVVVRVRPGAETVAEIGPGLEHVVVEFTSKGRPASLDKGIGVAIGLGPVGSVHEFKGGGNKVQLSGVLPGPMLLLGAEGEIAVFDVDGPRVEADLGDARLIVQTPKGAKLSLWPAGEIAEDLVILFARRVQRMVPVKGAEGDDYAPLRLPAREMVVEAGEEPAPVRRNVLLEAGKADGVVFPAK